MYGTAARGKNAVDEVRLACAAAEGDGSAFAVLYQRYEDLVFNLAYRIGGSEEIACEAVEKAFLGMMRERGPVTDHGSIGPYLCMATRTACHDLMPVREDAGAVASRAADDAAGLEPAQKEIHQAGMRQTERQREALVLRELGGLSYGEIAAIMNVHPDAVAQLIFRARVNLSDELHGTMLGSTAASSSVCERALPLIAAQDDDQLDPDSADAAWLDSHLTGCERCGFAVEAMRRARDSYGAWAPSAVAAWLLPATMAKAADLAGADWSREISKAELAHGSSHSATAGPRLRAAVALGQARRRAVLAAGFVALLLLVGLVAILVSGDEAATIDPAAGSAAGRSAATPKGEEKSSKADRRGAGSTGKAQALTTAGESASLLTPSGTTTAPSQTPSEPDHAPTAGGAQPTHQTAAVHGAASKPKRTPAPAPASPPAPASAPTTTTESPPAAEPIDETPGNSHGKAEPPGKPSDRPPR